MKKLFIALSLLMVLSSGIFGNSILNTMAEETHNPNQNRYYTSIQIQPGDSLWSIAQEYSKDSPLSVTAYVDELRRMNNLKEDMIHADQYLTVVYFSSGE